MEGAGAGHSTTILVAGDAGVGKSRLVAEFAAEAEVQGVLVLVGTASNSVRASCPTRRFPERFAAWPHNSSGALRVQGGDQRPAAG